MTEQTKKAAVAVVTACSVLFAGAFAPTQQPQAAWWCTAFSVACEQAVEPSEDCETVEFRCKLVNWWRELTG